MVDVYHTHGFVMVDETVQMGLMNLRIVVQQIEHVQLAYGNVIMVDALVPIDDAMELMTAGRQIQFRKSFL